MSVKERLLEFLKTKGIGQSKFEKQVGLSNGFVSNIGDSIRSTSLNKIKVHFPDINTSWLLTGEGDMIIQNNKIKFNAPLENLISEMAEQLAANTAILNVLRPIVEELYAENQNERLAKIRIEINKMIEDEGERILDLIQRKWKA